MYGLVLAGGGARGAYEVGAWRALKEQGIEIGAVCGTSIGSINGAIFAQGDAELAEQLWRGISVSDVVDMSSFAEDKLMSVKNIRVFIDELRANNGLSMQPLEKLLREYIKEEKLLISPVDFGLVTYSVTDSHEIEMFKSDIPRGMLVDYLMASACLPGIKPRVIGDKTFMDGCVADNKPFGMLVKKGYRDIIAVDVGGVGVVKPLMPDGVNLIDVKCVSPMVGVLDFDKKLISDSIQAGYLDTKRAFGILSGEKYAIRTADYIRARRKYSAELVSGLESAAEIFGVSQLKEYTVISLARAVVKEYRRTLEAGGEKNSGSGRFARVCETLSGGNAENIAKLASAVLKKYSRAVNAVCYFSRILP